jgi:hypothetical protein
VSDGQGEHHRVHDDLCLSMKCTYRTIETVDDSHAKRLLDRHLLREHLVAYTVPAVAPALESKKAK